MRYLFVLVVFCMPTWVAANLLDADTSYSCQSETTFGWKDDASFSNPQLWVSESNILLNPLHKKFHKKDLAAISRTFP